ncbi:hypothetical protein OESDEN_07213 [Oesophagostomum dentatum]|uniref:Enoyl-CoA hydratase/isomerase family protein n=1 Tax=Oesophagostomum dentatum TaxID=61180 RepID=A0A0B1TC05_OESDE|nr:hypothetical protein OESDEN_07213 [Oesophagostomum dentatum]
MQQAFTNIEECCKPVIAAVHGVCYGGGIDIISACDVRHCTQDAIFSIKEVDVGLAADIGSLNRLPKICGNENLVSRVYNTREEMLKEVFDLAKKMAGKSPVAVQGTKEVDVGLAADVGSLNRLPKICGNENLVSRVYSTREEMLKEVFDLAKKMAGKSPVAVQGTKIVLNYSRDHTVEEGLRFVATWNQSQLMTEDITKSVVAAITKSPTPPFAKI